MREASDLVNRKRKVVNEDFKLNSAVYSLAFVDECGSSTQQHFLQNQFYQLP